MCVVSVIKVAVMIVIVVENYCSAVKVGSSTSNSTVEKAAIVAVYVSGTIILV